MRSHTRTLTGVFSARFGNYRELDVRYKNTALWGLNRIAFVPPKTVLWLVSRCVRWPLCMPFPPPRSRVQLRRPHPPFTWQVTRLWRKQVCSQSSCVAARVEPVAPTGADDGVTAGESKVVNGVVLSSDQRHDQVGAHTFPTTSA